MLKNLTYQTKNRLLLLGAALLLLLSWPLALRKTFDSISLHHDLNRRRADKSDLSYNPQYLSEKDRTLDHLLSRYTLDSAEWKNEFWLKVSGAATGKGITVNYTPEQMKLMADTGKSKVIRQNISFSAGYGKLMALLDTLERMEGVGFVSSAKFERVKNMNAEGGDKLYLRTVFGVVRKEEKMN